jgi:hypothetical protein
VTDRAAQSTVSSWTIVAAIFGGVCNLSFVILQFYQEYCPQHLQPDWDCLQRIEADGVNLVLPTAIALAPSLVLFALHRFWPVVFFYASLLLSILIWRIEYPHQYYDLHHDLLKYDEPGLVLLLLGMISTVVVPVWVVFRLGVFIWGVLKSRRRGEV